MLKINVDRSNKIFYLTFILCVHIMIGINQIIYTCLHFINYQLIGYNFVAACSAPLCIYIAISPVNYQQ